MPLISVMPGSRRRLFVLPLAIPSLLLLAAPGSAVAATEDAAGRDAGTEAVLRAADRTRVGEPALSPAGLAALVPPARVVGGTELEEKPPPWQLPVAAYHLTGRFGASSSLWSSSHTGLDFAAPEGTPLVAIGPGTVVSAESDGAFGNKTVVRLDDGTELWYCHQSAFVAEPGQRVGPGTPIGRVGSTGNVTGPHLHLEVHPTGDAPVDPDQWLRDRGLAA
ncbi:M23 family metallopeptidase [Nocardioides aurantiacus]|uniref:Murein DD-endopeptidase MepM/ murein hydrolase activator NlpD n=1 Tax=Nocardioides aurantiacus TaxID=86796 RepID=A0A3N2CT20_9ACTN|nr:M23 family metallopeptidase [Nocardioides aurantiacus]ROR90693.1 murein DD-endopeptidase MepM/ murein hydrolase activator NlpD [Nocardioides aurantiacus]